MAARASPTPNFDRLAARARDLRQALCRQPALHAGAARHADRPAHLPAPQLGAARAVRQRLPRDCCTEAGVYSHLSPTTSTIGRTAAPPITTATTATSSSAARRATPGRRWCSRTGSGCARCTTRASSATERRDYFAQNIVNREFIREEKDFPSVQCFAHGFEFLDRNRDADNWLLQIETFDPHEPFHAPARFKERLRDRLERPDPRLAALRPRRRAAGGVRGAARQLLRRRRALRLPARPAARLLRRSTTCGRTRRSSSPPTTASCSASTISGPRTG